MGLESTIKVCGLLNTVPISVHYFLFCISERFIRGRVALVYFSKYKWFMDAADLSQVFK